MITFKRYDGFNVLPVLGIEKDRWLMSIWFGWGPWLWLIRYFRKGE